MSLFDLMVKLAGKAALPKRGRRRNRKSEVNYENAGRYPTPIVMDRGCRRNKRGERVNPKTVRSQRTRKRVAAWREKYGVLV